MHDASNPPRREALVAALLGAALAACDVAGTVATDDGGGDQDGPAFVGGAGTAGGPGGPGGTGGAASGGDVVVGAGGEGSAGPAGPAGPGATGASASSSSSSSGGEGGGGAGSGGGGPACTGDCTVTGCAAGLTCVEVGGGCTACACTEPTPLPAATPTRSLYVTELESVERFDLERVLARLLESAGATDQTPLELYQQWWDLNADDATGAFDGPHCTDTLNGYPLQCPRDEAQLATTDPFSPTPLYTTVGLVNRIDKMPLDGSTCGQHRVSFNLMREIPGADPDFNYFIIELVVPNPRPELGVAGCLPLAKTWYDLTSHGGPGPADRAARADVIEALYFEGIAGFPPLLSWENLRGSLAGSGQIRANQFLHSVSGQMWQLREYHLERLCDGSGCRLEVRMDTVKDNPFGLLFRAPGSPEAPAEAAAFQAWFVDQVESLATAADVNDLALAVPEVWNAGESTQPGFLGENPQDFWNDYGLQGASNPGLLAAIQARLTEIGSPLTPRNVLDRATATSCAGCHQIASNRDLGGGMVHPDSLRFVHTDETRGMSPAVRDSFLPRRQAALMAYLDAQCGGPPPVVMTPPEPPATPAARRALRSIGGGLALGH